MMNQEYILRNNVMHNVKQAVHLGIIRTNTLADNMTVNVEANIKKSRRSAYGLFGRGFPSWLHMLLKKFNARICS
jgi:hypothetical protein